MTLTEFLTARLDQDEVVAREEPWVSSGGAFVACAATPTYTPPRPLREVEAKRAIVARLDEVERGPATIPSSLAYSALCHLATVYADHPDYDESWRPVTRPASGWLYGDVVRCENHSRRATERIYIFDGGEFRTVSGDRADILPTCALALLVRHGEPVGISAPVDNPDGLSDSRSTPHRG
jgi:hypothetical protein